MSTLEVFIPPVILPERVCGAGELPCAAQPDGEDVNCTREKDHPPDWHVAHIPLPCGRIVAIARWSVPS